MQESCSNEADQTCLLCLFYQRPQKTFGGEITNKWANFQDLKFWMLGTGTSLTFQSSHSASACSRASAALMSSSNRGFISCWFVRRAYCNLRNEIKICNLQNKLEICNLRNRNVSFAKRKSVIVSRARVQGWSLFKMNFIPKNFMPSFNQALWHCFSGKKENIQKIVIRSYSFCSKGTPFYLKSSENGILDLLLWFPCLRAGNIYQTYMKRKSSTVELPNTINLLYWKSINC